MIQISVSIYADDLRGAKDEATAEVDRLSGDGWQLCRLQFGRSGNPGTYAAHITMEKP